MAKKVSTEAKISSFYQKIQSILVAMATCEIVWLVLFPLGLW